MEKMSDEELLERAEDCLMAIRTHTRGSIIADLTRVANSCMLLVLARNSVKRETESIEVGPIAPIVRGD